MESLILKGRSALLFLVAAVFMVSCGTDGDVWPSAPEPEGCRDVSISGFRNASDGEGAWYRISGDLVSVADAEAGSFYLADNTGYVFVYGMEGFSRYGLVPGDRVSLFVRKGYYMGRIEGRDALYAGHTVAGYPGYRAPVANAAWAELPAMQPKDGQVFLHHAGPGGGRNYSLCYDTRHRVPVWAAYVLCRDKRGTGRRTDAYALDPLLDRGQQAALASRSYSPGNGASYIRGHLVPSADRLDMRDNLDVFLCTNIVPQDNRLNEGCWEDLEKVIRDKWMPSSDSLYIVAGTVLKGSGCHVLDNDGVRVTVPVQLYKAVLSYSHNGGYRGVALLFKNGPEDASGSLKDRAMSIDALESGLGLDLFANLPDNLELAVESADPRTDEFWW